MRQECNTEFFKQKVVNRGTFSLAIHNALAKAQRECGPREHLFDFLDDVYATSNVQDGTRTLYDSSSVFVS